MARYSEPYTLYTRRMKDGREVYYYMPRDPETGKRLSGISTGTTSSRKAHLYCEQLLREGRLIPSPKEAKPPTTVRRSRRLPTLAEWVAERSWWVWGDDGPACEYCKQELKRSSEAAPAVQRYHADRSRMVVEKDILPHHGDRRLDQITPEDCEELLSLWADEGILGKTINNRRSVYKVMMGEAERLNLISASPWRNVKGYYAKSNPKGILSKDEYMRLMSPANREAVWGRGEIYYCVNLLASVTGMRQGEILALRREHIHPDHVTVEHSYNEKYGLGPQKTKRGVDQLPIPRMVYDIISPLLLWDGYVFSFNNGKTPCNGSNTANALNDALGKIGISKEERLERNIFFHSWRAFANTYFRSVGVPDVMVRTVTRHKSAAMTDHYSDFHLEDFREVAEAQDSLTRLLQEK